MRFWTGVVAAALLGTLGGCETVGVTSGAHTAYAPVPDPVAVAGAGVIQTDVPAPGATLLGSVEATACPRVGADNEHANELALALLKVEATKKGAAYVSNVTYHKGTVVPGGSCQTPVVADGVASK
jgi:hypothetical protein